MNTNDYFVDFLGIRNKQRITCDWYLDNKKRECLINWGIVFMFCLSSYDIFRGYEFLNWFIFWVFLIAVISYDG